MHRQNKSVVLVTDTVVESNELDNKMFSQENEEDIWDIQINDMDELVEELFGKVCIRPIYKH